MIIPRVAFATATGQVTVAVAVAAALPVVSAIFPDDRCADAGGEADLLLEPNGDGYVLRTPRRRRSESDLETALVQLELALAEELVRRSGLAGLHAGGVVLNGRAILFPGDGGRGKSSLTAALARRGLPVLGDDVVLLDGDGLAHPFRRLLKVEEPARTILQLPSPSEPLRSAWPDAAFYRPADLDSRWAEPTPVGAIVIPARTEGVAAQFLGRRPTEILTGLLAGIVLSDRIAPGVFDAVAAALGGARCWELRYGTTPEGADVLLDALGRGPG